MIIIEESRDFIFGDADNALCANHNTGCSNNTGCSDNNVCSDNTGCSDNNLCNGSCT